MSGVPETSNWDYDVVVLGGGLSGITAAYYLKHKTDKSFIVLDRYSTHGGTWELFKYPGIRSDSDMYSFSFSFHPWNQEKYFGTGNAIKDYLREVMETYNLGEHFRYETKVDSANFDTSSSTWCIRTSQGETINSNFFLCCSGYYDHEEGYTPDFPGFHDFNGSIIHPQFWPKNFDADGKRIVVIGSGATAITLVPELSKTNAASVTMLQRSPTFIAAVPDNEKMGTFSKILYSLLGQRYKQALFRYRRVNAIFLGYLMYYVCKRFPKTVKSLWLKQLKRSLGEENLKHFSPDYYPWDQRVCAAPNGDFFKQFKQHRFNIVTEHIDRFTENGILLKNGEELPCDTIVTATGLKLISCGGVRLSVDNLDVFPKDQFIYKGLMLTNLPNMFWVTGYTNASWTLKAELSCDHIARMMNYMEKRKKGQVVPVMDEKTAALGEVNGFDLNSGYVLRYLDEIPKQGTKYPWQVYQNYFIDSWIFSGNNFNDGVAQFSKL